MQLKEIRCSKEWYGPQTRAEEIIASALLPSLFFSGDAENLAPGLIAPYVGRVQLIYLDPPYQTGDVFPLRLQGGEVQLNAYADTRTEDAYLRMMRAALLTSRQLLHKTGSIYLHVDYRMCAPLRLLMDEIFGRENFLNEIIWSYQSGGRSTRHYSRKHDVILFYRKSKQVYFDVQAVGTPRGSARRNHMRRFTDENGRICYSIVSNGKTYVYSEDSLTYPADVWTDIPHMQQRTPERTGYFTQKPEALLKRIVLASSKPGDLVADFFCGSGTTAAVAVQEGRSFLAADSSPFARYVCRKRLLAQNTGFTMHSMENMQPFPATIEAARTEEEALSVSCAAPLLYCASGFIKDDVFHFHAGVDLPGAVFCIDIPKEPSPALLLMDQQGREAYFLMAE